MTVAALAQSDGPPRVVPRCFGRRSEAGFSAGAETVEPHDVLSETGPSLLQGLADAHALGIAGLLPAMVCGEESAVMVFSNERARVDEELFADSKQMLDRIAREEERHEGLLRSLASMLPVVEHDEQVRREARRFFLGLKAQEVGDHFSRIAWLDSGVCVIFARLIASGSPVRSAPALHRALRRILRDEASHVAFSRRYAAHLGVKAAADKGSFHLVRGGLVSLLEPCGHSFEKLGIDPDDLFRELKCRGIVESVR